MQKYSCLTVRSRSYSERGCREPVENPIVIPESDESDSTDQPTPTDETVPEPVIASDGEVTQTDPSDTSR